MTPTCTSRTNHQRRDSFWQHGSVCEDFEKITAAVYAIGGFADGYTDAVFRLLAKLKCPKKGLVGPWYAIMMCCVCHCIAGRTVIADSDVPFSLTRTTHVYTNALIHA
eukprot:GFYU01078456.1.p1 GENE.GFYU01078456.1~~GFYU01078456.1.p1  ORF type:complete len:120 (-),score=7.58 GFYU01078456.1:387-710(-)